MYMFYQLRKEQVVLHSRYINVIHIQHKPGAKFFSFFTSLSFFVEFCLQLFMMHYFPIIKAYTYYIYGTAFTSSIPIHIYSSNKINKCFLFYKKNKS